MFYIYTSISIGLYYWISSLHYFFIFQFVYLFVCVNLYLFICKFDNFLICLFIHFFLFIFLFFYSFIFLFICTFVSWLLFWCAIIPTHLFVSHLHIYAFIRKRFIWHTIKWKYFNFPGVWRMFSILRIILWEQHSSMSWDWSDVTRKGQDSWLGNDRLSRQILI